MKEPANALTLSAIAIISADAELAELVSSHFRFPRTYVVLLEAPPKRLVEFGVYAHDCTRVANALTAHQPQVVLFVGCDNETKEHLRTLLKGFAILDIDSWSPEAIEALTGYKAIPVNVPTYGPDERVAGHIVAVEGDNPMALVIAKNIAVAMAGSVFVMPHVSEDVATKTVDDLRTWGNESGLAKEDAKNSLLEFITRQIGTLSTDGVESITFITRGVPYGVFPFRRPTTHLFSYPLLGVYALTGMLKSLRAHVRCPITVIIDPNSAEASETEALKKAFAPAGYIVREALGPQATATSVRYLVEYLPSDFLFFTTHCGEVRGVRLTEQFPTKEGLTHTIVYDSAKTIHGIPGSEMLELQDFIRPVSLDGIMWSDDQGKRLINAGESLKQFLEIVRDVNDRKAKNKILKSERSPRIQLSDSLQMHNFDYYSPNVLDVGGSYCPVVFNNSCSSWGALSMRFGCRGASVYVGTSLDVLNALASVVAVNFGERVSLGHNIGYSLFKAQKTFTAQLGYTPYLMHGYLFTSIRPIPVRVKAQQIAASRILGVLKSWDENPETNVRRRLRKLSRLGSNELSQ